MSDKLIKESINSYIKNSIPSMVENIMEIRIPRGFMGKASIFAQEVGNRALGAAEKFNIKERMRSSDINARQTGHIRDIQLRQSGFDPGFVKDVQQNYPNTMPRTPAANATQRHMDNYETAVEKFKERQQLEKDLARARRINPGLARAENDVMSLRKNYITAQQRSSQNIDPTNKNSFIGRAERLARIRGKIR